MKGTHTLVGAAKRHHNKVLPPIRAFGTIVDKSVRWRISRSCRFFCHTWKTVVCYCINICTSVEQCRLTVIIPTKIRTTTLTCMTNEGNVMPKSVICTNNLNYRSGNIHRAPIPTVQGGTARGWLFPQQVETI